MESKKINQLATEMSPEGSDLTIIGDPITGVSRKITLIQLAGTIGAGADLQQVTDNGATTTNPIAIGGLTITGLATGVLKSDSGVISSVPFGAANGVATLGGDGKVPSNQLPSYVDDVVEVANFASLPVTGETGKIYITLDNNKVYRWTGSIYVEIAANNAVWGAITGTLSNQTDLQTALNLKANDNAVVHLAGTETISGVKTFTTSNLFTGANLFTNFSQRFNQGVAILETANFGATLDYTTIVGAVNGLALRLSSDGKKIFAFADATTNNTFTFPNATGTIALTSNLSSYVPYTGATANVNLGLFDLYAQNILATDTSGNWLSALTRDGGTAIGVLALKSGGFTNYLQPIATVSSARTWTLPDASGTIALTSDIPSLTGYVPYTGATTNVNLGTFDLTADVITGATGSFASSGGSDTFAINHSSGSGIALNITKGGNGEGLYINKTSGSGNAATIIGTLNATTLVKSGGTSSQFLKADGSVDSSTYLTTSAAASTYLPLTGGTLTGALNGTSAVFSSTVQASAYRLTGMTAGAGALYWSSDRVTLANYNATGLVVIEANGGTITSTFGGATYNNDFVGTGRFTGALSGTSATFSTEVTSSGGQGRFGGWAIGAGYQGNALEVGVTGGVATLTGYNRTTSVFLPIAIFSGNQSTTIDGNTILLKNNGTPALSIASTGAATFSSSVTAASTLYLGNDGTYGSTYRTLGLTGITNGTHRIFAGTSDNLYIAAATSRGIEFWTDGSSGTKMLITSGGNVGIGTSSPTNGKLEVQTGSTAAGLWVQTGGTTGSYTIADFRTGTNLSALSIKGNGYSTFSAYVEINSSETALRLNVGSGLNALSIGGTGAISVDYPGVGAGRFSISDNGNVGMPRTYGFTTSNAANLFIDSNGLLYRSTSSLKYKTNVEDLTINTTDLLSKMRPVWYRSIGDADRKDWSWYGFIAEELALIEPRLVHFGYNKDSYEEVETIDDKGDIKIETKLKDNAVKDEPDGVQYERITVLLVAEIQKMRKEIEQLKNK